MTMHTRTFPDNTFPCATLAELLARQAAERPDQPLAIFPDQSVDFGTLYREARALAKGLIALGIKPGDHVGIFIPNHAHFLLAHFATQLAGGIGILLNARFKQHELRYAVPHADVRVLITTDSIDAHVNFADVLNGAFPELAGHKAAEPLSLEGAPLLRHVIRFGESKWDAALGKDDLVARGAAVTDEQLEAASAGRDPESVSVMIFTSGTTADPKACQLSHAGLQRAWRTYVRTVKYLPGEKVWVPMPFFHSGGIGLITCMTEVGGTLATSPHFDPSIVMRMVRENHIEHLYPGFHTLALPVLQDPAYDRDACSYIRSMVCVGPMGTQRKLQAMLPDHAPIMNLFGMSESSGLLLLADANAEPELRLEAAGQPPIGVDIRIIDPETGREQPAGVSGEIQFRGGGAFLGYYNNPAVTSATITDGGWVRTGDLGRVDANGWLTFIGRLKDMLKVGGENVAAAEIEAFLSGHPAIKFVQVVGKPDDRMTEVPVAFVELNPGQALDFDALVTFCTGKIARFKIPVEMRIVNEWPMSATKVQKFKLKEQLL